MPTTSDTIMNSTSLLSVATAMPALTDPVCAMPDSNTSIAMARMSSMIRMPTTSCAKFSPFMPSSDNALTMIVAEEIASMAPRKSESIVPAEPSADFIAAPNHQHDLGQYREEVRRAHLEQLAQIKFESEREHQEDDAEFVQGLNGGFVVNEVERRRCMAR